MKRIPLTKGKFAIVDDEDFEYLNQEKWHLLKGRSGNEYAYRRHKNKTIYMHRQIVKAKKGENTDHIDHNCLDNRKQNLRICTRSQNNHNRRPNLYRKTSRYKGVTWHELGQKWVSRIQFEGKQHYLGLFNSEIEAVTAYQKMENKCFKEFAYKQAI